MAERADKREVLVSYLLGTASGVEREAVEEECFADSSGVELLLGVEDELIDDYARGSLSTTDRLLFEQNFLCTADRRQRLEFTQSLVAALAGNEVGDPLSAEREALDRSPLAAQLRGQAGSRIEGSRGQFTLDRGQELFESLLTWLDPVRATAADKYEKVRERLIGMFASRGCVDAEDLADETIDRVSRGLAKVKETYVGEPTLYFHAVANKLLLEYSRARVADPVSESLIDTSAVDREQAQICLERCLGQLSESNRKLIRQFYSSEKSKVDVRQDLAQSLGVSLSTLRVRAHRIRTSLQKCVASCLDEANIFPYR